MTDPTNDFIPCMLIPLRQHYLLLPHATIAEVIPMPTFNHTTEKPPFWLGHYNWNKQSLAIIDLEQLIETMADDVVSGKKLCIIHSINPDNAINAFAIPCYGAQQLIHLNDSALKSVEPATDTPFLHYRSHIANRVAYIPNLDAIENTICHNL